MFTISNIVEDVSRGCVSYNMVETCFSYRIIFYINENNTGRKCFVDTSYENLRQSLENIIRGNLSTTNTLVIAAITARKNGETISLLNRAYGFNLNDYFRKLCEENEKDNINSNYRRRRAQWY